MAGAPSRQARRAQWFILLGLAGVCGFLGWNVAANLAHRNVPFGFGYLANTANFDIPFHLIDFAPSDTYAWALLVCVLNTLLVSALSIVTATALGVVIGIMRLSANWLVRTIALWFIELVRNTPMLVQIVFWYVAVLQALPGPRQSIVLPFGILLNIRGLYLPVPLAGAHAVPLAIAALVLLALTPFVWRWTWRGRPLAGRALLLPLAGLALCLLGIDGFDRPVPRGFNLAGGVQLPPELAAVWAGLSIYSAAFIAEIVRGSIQSVARGQREAALSLGFTQGQVLWLVVLPQALRMMVPPLTSQYLNLIKSSSLGAAVAYPEVFQIFAGTVLNQSGREVETFAIVMALFLTINLVVSSAMNFLNGRLVRRGMRR